MDTHHDKLKDDDAARVLIIDHLGGPDEPGTAWQERDPRRTAIEGLLHGKMLVARAALDLIREDVEQARLEGLSWESIAAALDLPIETARLAYGGEVTPQ